MVARLTDATGGVATTVNLADRAARMVRFVAIRSTDVSESAHRVGAVLEDVSPWVPGAKCLHRAAAGRVWLAALGIQSQIVVGVRRDRRWQGHAWLEVSDDDSRLVIFAEEVEFRPIWRRGE